MRAPGVLRILLACLALASLSAGLLACGGDDDDDGGGVAESLSGDQALAQDADAKAGARTAQTVLEVLYTESQTYEATPEELAALDPTLSEVDLTVEGTADTYEVTATSESGNTFTVSRDAAGAVTMTCETAGEGGCEEGGTW